MPLMLFIYGRFFLDFASITIPYLQIAGQLCYVVIPVSLGMLLKWRFPAAARAVVRHLMRPLVLAFFVTILGLGTYINLPIYNLLGEYPLLIPTAAALPWIGFVLAGFCAFLLGRPRAEVLTISIETGIQNIGIAILVLIYSMPQPEGDIGAVMPLVVSMFTPLPLFLAYLVLVIKEGRCSRCSPCCRRRLDGENEDPVTCVSEGPWGQAEPLRGCVDGFGRNLGADVGDNGDADDDAAADGEEEEEEEPETIIQLASKRGRTYSKEHVISAILSP